MGIYWLGFGLITSFYPALMDLFQTDFGIESKTSFSDHVWFHGGLDILAFCVLLFALSSENLSKRMVQAVAIAALLPAFAIFYSVAATPFWTLLFVGSGVGCLAFSIWGFSLARKME
jgi:predicted acyltransferase